MATQKIQLGVEISDNGSAAKTQKNVKDLHSELKAAQKTAQNIGVGGGAGGQPGGSPGSRAVAARAQPAGSQTMSGQDYGNARGTAGVTGASARDFANQSQGLGGLVRLYATFAANIFAVSAAFTALSSAMDTANMVRGLDQLGAATGRNLGGLSKRLVEITDGAISFRDSMEAVAKTTSSGMSTRDIERLAMVAKNASLALGVAMPDAISRLSRGITKLEPELLDELGIMTKIDPAVQAYSRSVGKAASQLTDFERRQAFANAVLAEGESKFGELATAAVNPYDRLLSTLKNVSTEALNVLNTVLGPLVNLLASSPGALTGALAVLGTLLVRQALPALTQFKAGLASAADVALTLAKTKAEDAKAARTRIDKQIIQEVEARAEKEVAAVDAAEKKIQQLRQAGYKKNSVAARLLAADLDDIRQEDLAKQERITKGLESKATKLAADPKIDPKAIEGAKRAAEANREVLTSIIAAKKAQEDYLIAERNITTEREKAARGWSIYGLALQAAKNAEDTATKKSIISNAAYNASLIGVSGAFKLLNAEIVASGLALGKWEAAALKTKAAGAIVLGVIGAIGSAINKALGIIATIAAVISILDSVISSATKELDAFSSSVTKIEDAVANANRVLDYLDKKGGYASKTIEGVNSLANALTELSTSAEDAVKSNIRAQAAMGAWDSVKDSFFKVGGGGVQNNLAKSLGKDLVTALEILSKAGIDKVAREKFKTILGIETLDLESVTGAILKLSDSAQNNLVSALNESTTALNNSNSRLQSFKSATESTTKAFQDFILSTANTNPLFKLGSSLETLGKTMSDVVTGGAAEMEAAMISLASSPEKGMLFGPEFTTRLVGIKDEFLTQSATVEAYTNRVKELDAAIELNSKKAKLRGLAGESASKELPQLISSRNTVQNALDLFPKEKIKEAREIFVQGMQNAFIEGSKYIDIALGQSAQKAAQIIAKANLGGLTGEARAIEETRIAKQDIAIQLRAIDTNISLILVNERLTSAIEVANARAALTQAKAEGKSQEIIKNLEIAQTVAEVFNKVLGTRGTPNLRGDIAKREKVEDPLAAAQLNLRGLTVGSRIAPQQASRVEVAAAGTAADITGRRAQLQGRFEDFQKEQSYETAKLQLTQTRLGLLQSITSVITKQGVLQQAEADAAILNNKQLIERKAIDLAISTAANGEPRKKQESYKLLLLANQEEEKRNLVIQNRQKLLQVELAEIAKRFELERSNSELQKTLATITLDTRSQELALYTEAYDLSKQFVISQQIIIDKQRAFAEASTATQAAQDSINQKREEAELRIAALRASDPSMSGATIAAIAAENAELERQQAIVNNTVASLSAQFNARISILDKTKEINVTQERYNELLLNSSQLADTLANAFGKVGTAIGGIATAFADMVISTEKSAASMARLVEQRDSLEKGSEDRKNVEKEISKQQEKNLRNELVGYTKVASSAKSFFKEKTAAYRVLAATEKAMQVATLLMDAKAFAMKMGWLTAEVATTVGAETAIVAAKAAAAPAKVAADSPGILSSFANMGPVGYAVGLAIVAALVAMAGGGKSSSMPGFVMGAEQRQETQGTGTAYDSMGNKYETGGGVFGDASEKLDSINKSMTVLKDNSIDGLFYDNRMLNALERIAKSITGAAEAIYSTPGIRSGLNFGTLPGSLSSGGFLSSIPLIGGTLSKVFGGKTSSTSSITDAGIALRGSLQDIADAVGGSVVQYKDILTQFTKSGGLFSKDKSWTTQSREINAVSTSVLESFSEIFTESKALFSSVANIAGISASEVDRVFAETTATLDISLLGLKGEDVVKELNASISSQLDIVSKQLFSSFDKYRKFGEGYTDTVLRIVDANNKITVTLEAMGNTVTKVSGNFDASETIIAGMALSLENFTEQAKFFIDNFLTEAERVNVTRTGVTSALTELSLPASLTRAEFRNLVQSLDLTTISGRNMYQGLMDLAPEFIKVTQLLEDLKTETGKLSIDLLRAQEYIVAADAATRALATEGMTAAELAAYDYNESLRKQIDALKEANQAIKSAQSTITSLQNTATDQYLSATQKVADAQQNIANLSIEAAKRMRDFGKSIREFISQQLNITNANTNSAFAKTVDLALSGNIDAIQGITGIAQQAIESAKNTAQSASEFAEAKGALLSKVIEVAAFAESEAAKTVIPAENEPLIAANKALELAILEQTKAQQVANTLGASLIKTPEDLIAKYTIANQDLAMAIARWLSNGGNPDFEPKFARGGVFSNRVITGATRFQFGEMGEAGPEAIMPLTRTRDGSLGVISQPLTQNSFSDALIGQNVALVTEVRALREEVNLLRFEARATAAATGKTTRILERVTRDGESLIVTDSATL